MWSIESKNLEWVAGKPGVERATLRDHPEGGRTYLVRMKSGCASGMHRHRAPEEVLVLEGRVNIGGHALDRGDFLFTEEGEAHDVVALEDATILVSTSKPIDFL